MATARPGDLAGLRDQALLLAAAGLRRAAPVGLDVEQIRFVEIGADLILHGHAPALPQFDSSNIISRTRATIYATI